MAGFLLPAVNTRYLFVMTILLDCICNSRVLNRWLQPRDSTLVLDAWPKCMDPALRPMERWGRRRRGKTAIEMAGGTECCGCVDLTVVETQIQSPEAGRYCCCRCRCWRGTLRFHCHWHCTQDWAPVRKSIIHFDLDHTSVLDYTPDLDQRSSPTKRQGKG